jgi:hypothetical protein
MDGRRRYTSTKTLCTPSRRHLSAPTCRDHERSTRSQPPDAGPEAPILTHQSHTAASAAQYRRIRADAAAPSRRAAGPGARCRRHLGRRRCRSQHGIEHRSLVLPEGADELGANRTSAWADLRSLCGFADEEVARLDAAKLRWFDRWGFTADVNFYERTVASMDDCRPGTVDRPADLAA